MENTTDNRQRRGRIIFILMAIFFAVPLVVVMLMYKLDWRPVGQSYGELLQPVREIVLTDGIQEHSGKPVEKFWTDKWNMVYVAEVCEQICQQRMHDMRQLHVSLYKDVMRVQRVLITTQEDTSSLHNNYPDMLIIKQPKDKVIQLAMQFNIKDEQALSANRLYLVDPLGHIVMHYKTNIKAANIRKDLTRLLRYSWAG